MPLVVTCKTCGSKFQAPDHLAGKRGKCPNCSAVIELAAAAEPAAPTKSASSADVLLTAGERLHPCPDCGKMISRRAQQCPHCGCPIVETVSAAPSPARTGAVSSRPIVAPGQSAAEAVEPSRKLLLAAGGGAAALAIVAALVILVVRSMWSHEPPASPVVAQPAPPAAAGVPQEQKDAWIQEVATARATEVDNLYSRLHATKLTLANVQQTSDLLKAMADTGDLSKLPAEEAPAARPQPYASQINALFEECSQYLRSSLPSGDYRRDDVLAVGERWLKGKEAPVLKQLEQLASQPGLLEGLDFSAPPPGAAPDASPAAPAKAPPAVSQ